MLVADNCPDTLHSWALLLRLWGHVVETADDGPSALVAALGGRPDVVLMDLALRDLDGLAVLKELAGELEAAEQLILGARKNEPSLPQLSKNLGDLAYRASRYDEAWEAYHRAVELAPDLGDDVYFKLGNIAYKRNDRERAAQLWGRALELNPKHELVKANLDTLSALS